MKFFWYWWAFFCINLLGLGVAEYYDGYNWLLNADATKFSLITIISYIFISIYVGKLTYRAGNNIDPPRKSVNSLWFYSEACLSVGMLGTLVGFLMVFGTAFATLDIKNTASVAELIKNMGYGVSTSLITTLVGLGISLLTKMQLVNLENASK